MKNLEKTDKSIPWTEQLGLANFRDLLANIGYQNHIPQIECVLMSPILGMSPEQFKKVHDLEEYESPMDFVWFAEYNIFKLMEEDFCNTVKRFRYIITEDLIYDIALAAALRYELWSMLSMDEVYGVWNSSLNPPLL